MGVDIWTKGRVRVNGYEEQVWGATTEVRGWEGKQVRVGLVLVGLVFYVWAIGTTPLPLG